MAARAKSQKQRDQAAAEQEREVFAVRAAVEPTTLDAEARTIEVTWSTGAAVRRFDWYREVAYDEILSMDARHVRLDRLNARAPVLDTHSRWGLSNVLGVVESARLANGKGVAKLRFSSRADVEDAWTDIREGIICNVSVGYSVAKWQRETADGQIEKRTAVDWTPYEISMVPIGADAGAQVRALDDDDNAARGAEEMGSMTEEEKKAAAEAAAAEAKRKLEEAQQRANQEATEAALVVERKRVADINALCDAHGVEGEKRGAWLTDGKVTVDGVRAFILDGIAQRNKVAQISPAVHSDGGRTASMVRDASDALLLRAGMKVEGDGHRNFGAGSLIRMADAVLRAGGVNTSMLSDNDIAKRALATSDFASILNLVGVKLVRTAYEATPLVHRAVFRKSTANDFKAKNVVQVAGGQLLEKVPEGGKIPSGKIAVAKAAYALETYGKIVPFTRQMIVNDDFGAIAATSAQRGRAAAETERKTVWDFVQSNPTSRDGLVCFDDTVHKNKGASTTGVGVTAATLNAARKALRERTSGDGVSINSELKHIVCGTALESTWDQLLNGLYVPTAASTAMTARMRSAVLHIEPLVVAQDWFAFADYNQVDHFEFAYLAGNEGPQFEQRYNFETDGLELKVTLDFGVGCIDDAGAYMLDNSATS